MNYTPTDMVIDLLNGIVCKDKEYETCMEYLKDLKTIEEELGIDLITLFKALKNGCYVKTKNGIFLKTNTDIRIRPHSNQWQLYFFSYSRVFTKDYGKTWALTKEELE